MQPVEIWPRYLEISNFFVDSTIRMISRESSYISDSGSQETYIPWISSVTDVSRISTLGPLSIAIRCTDVLCRRNCSTFVPHARDLRCLLNRVCVCVCVCLWKCCTLGNFGRSCSTSDWEAEMSQRPEFGAGWPTQFRKSGSHKPWPGT